MRFFYLFIRMFLLLAQDRVYDLLSVELRNNVLHSTSRITNIYDTEDNSRLNGIGALKFYSVNAHELRFIRCHSYEKRNIFTIYKVSQNYVNI
jgi:hypothetical protein